MNWLVALLGARMNYAVPRILHETGQLERLFTDFAVSPSLAGWLRRATFGWQPAGVNRLLTRTPIGIPDQSVRSFAALGLNYAWRRRHAHGPGAQTELFLEVNADFCRRVCRCDWGRAESVFTFNAAGLEILEAARGRGLRTVIEQTIAPRAVEQVLLRHEHDAFPGWESTADDRHLAAYCDREQTEWQLADVIVCGSEFVRDGIAECGGPAERCVVIPYGIDDAAGVVSRDDHSGPLRVLTVGAVGLRKGTPYVMQSAARLRGVAAFRMVGPIDVSPDALTELRRHVQVIGSVPRRELSRHYAWADVFLLPSLCEGSATVTYDALAHGLPVIATPNTGSVVRDSIDGFIVPPRDVTAIVACLDRLAHDRERLAELAWHARERSRDYTLAAYARRLLHVLTPAPRGPDRTPTNLPSVAAPAVG